MAAEITVTLGAKLSFEVFKIYVGWDSREVDAYDVAVRSLKRHSSHNLCVTPLKLRDLELQGLMRRPLRRFVDHGINALQTWDVISDATVSTEFAASRFLVPALARTGWALFVDCDVVFLADVAELFALADPDKAVMCVQHPAFEATGTKMDGQAQQGYLRKNWSSVMLFNCDHPKNLGLTLDAVNTWPGRDLHRFRWLDDHDIGMLPAEWNWLVNVQPRPKNPKLAHFTLGGPWIPNWKRQPYDDLWLGASQNC